MTEQDLTAGSGKWAQKVHACVWPTWLEIAEARLGVGSIWQCDCGKEYRLSCFLSETQPQFTQVLSAEEQAFREARRAAFAAKLAEQQATQTKPNPWKLWHRS